jgi:single-strand DNA-binding protein
VSNVGFKGNIGKVRGLQFGNDGKPRFSFSVAEGHSRFNKQTNEWEDTGTTWWNVTAFGKQAETLADVIQEGQKQRVTVVGRAQTRHWEKDGNSGDSLDVIADSVGLIPAAQQQTQQPTQQPQHGGFGQPQQTFNGGWGGQPAEPPF